MNGIQKIDCLIQKGRVVPKPIKWLKVTFFRIINPALVSLYYKFFLREIEGLERGTQLFFVGRHDFGTQLYLLHYATLWEQKRGPAAVIVLTSTLLRIQIIANKICPNVRLIYPNRLSVSLPLVLFGSRLIDSFTYKIVYPWLVIDRPDALRLFELGSQGRERYSPYMDKFLLNQVERFPKDFIESYISHRKWFDCRMDAYYDYSQLVQACTKPKICFQSDILKKLGCSKPYVLMNINIKEYGHYKYNEKAIQHPDKYNVAIDDLIKRGYHVILHGRQEQPTFAAREGLFDYSKSPFTSEENDLYLFEHCEYVIGNKTGATVYAAILDKPVLALNFVEIVMMDPTKKHRFYPKYLRHKKTGNFLSWEEHLNSPAFFHVGTKEYCDGAYELVEMEEEEILAAIEEFLPLLQLSDEEWLDYSEKQREFKAALCPLHLDLYQMPGVPCEHYLLRSEQLAKKEEFDLSYS